MSAYYNEINPYAAQWLRNLIKAGHIADGEVDERSIREVASKDVAGFTQCHFFAGIGVWSYSLRCAGWPDSRPVWTGSCPCQPFSTAGKQAGFADERHLWPVWFNLIKERRPDSIFGEQVASKDGLAWLDLVLSDLESADYAAGAIDLCAAGIGAPHIRQRLWIVADSDISGLEGRGGGSGSGDQQSAGPHGVDSFWSASDWIQCRDGKARPFESGTFPLAHGVASRVGRLRAYGNAIVAPAATEVIKAYLEGETS